MTNPYSLEPGYPYNVMICNAAAKEDASLAILTHAFDHDNVITTLKLRYIFVAYKIDGTTDSVDLADVDYSLENIRVDNTFFLSRAFNFKEIYSDYKSVIGFIIKFKQLSNESYGNESVMNIVVDL